MITGIVLAAGLSTRMGKPKALLEVEGRSFLAAVIGALRDGGCGEVVVVTGPQDEDAFARIAEVARQENAWVEINPVSGTEQIHSLRIGLVALSQLVRAAVVAPVDVPRIDAATVARLIAAFEAEPDRPLAVATFGGEHGHPTLFARRVFDQLLAPDLPEGARTVVHAHGASLLEVPVDQPGVLLDVDTPDDYRRLKDLPA